MKTSFGLSDAGQKTIERIIVALLLLLYCFLQFPTLHQAPWEGYDSWRQSDTYSIAVNYAQYNMNPLRPQFNYDGTAGIYVQLELQIVPYLSAIIFKCIGFSTPFVPRLLSLLLFLGSALFVYRIARRFASFAATAVGLTVYLMLPISLLYARAIMPEACALFFYCGGVYFLLRWYEEDHGASVYLSAAFTALAIMEKTPTIFVGFLILAVFWWKLKARCFTSAAFYIFGAISLGLPAIYYIYASKVATISYVDDIAVKHLFTGKLFSLFTPEGVAFFQNNLPVFFTWSAILFAALGLAVSILRKTKFLTVWTLAFLAEWATVVAVIKFGYYLIFMAPVAAVLCALLCNELLGRRNIGKNILGVCLGLLIVLPVSRTGLAYWKKVTVENYIVQSVARLIEDTTEPGDVLAISNDNPVYLNAANRHGYRANIQYHADIPVGAEAETRYYRERGVSYFVVIQRRISNDAAGEYLAYVDETFPIAAENEFCTIYALR